MENTLAVDFKMAFLLKNRTKAFGAMLYGISLRSAEGRSLHFFLRIPVVYYENECKLECVKFCVWFVTETRER